MKKALVAYFSASGVTEKLAVKLAHGTGTDLFEIQAQEPYTEADLDWQNSRSRSSLEMKDRSSRPVIAGRVEDMAQYDVVFVGFPIWWYREPSIIDTFLEAYDFSGKQIVPFATSGSSGMGESGKNMEALTPGAKGDAGKRFSFSASGEGLTAGASRGV